MSKLTTEEIIKILQELPGSPTFNSEIVKELFNRALNVRKRKEGVGETLEDIQNRLRVALIKDPDLVFVELDELLKPGTTLHSHLLLLMARYTDYKEAQMKGIASFNDLGIEVRAIRNLALNLINNLEIEHLK